MRSIAITFPRREFIENTPEVSGAILAVWLGVN